MTSSAPTTAEVASATRRARREADRSRRRAVAAVTDVRTRLVTSLGHRTVALPPSPTTCVAPASAATPTRRWLPRAALLGALGAVTIVAPLTGAVQSGTASAAASSSSSTLVEHLATRGASVQEASNLAADPAAETRAMTTASRTYLREALQCPVESVANGTLSAVMGSEAPAPEIVMPVAEGQYRMTSGYGYRTYPFSGMHEGTDFAGDVGTPLHAVADGVVTYAGGPRDGRTGHIVVIQAQVDGQPVELWYGHQYASGIKVTVGQHVEAGDVIGEIGNDGRSTGPHVHFEVHTPDGQTTVDPLQWLQSHQAKPVQNLC